MAATSSQSYLDKNLEGLNDLQVVATADCSSESYSGDPEDVESGGAFGNDDESGSTDTAKSSESREKMILAKKETRAVLGLRLLVFVVLFLAAVTVCFIVY